MLPPQSHVVNHQFIADTVSVAQVLSARALFHLHGLQKLSEPERGAQWPMSLAAMWFGAYDQHRLVMLCQRVASLAFALRDPGLTIDCLPLGDKKLWGSALPGIPEIRLRASRVNEARAELTRQNQPNFMPKNAFGAVMRSHTRPALRSPARVGSMDGPSRCGRRRTAPTVR